MISHQFAASHTGHKAPHGLPPRPPTRRHTHTSAAADGQQPNPTSEQQPQEQQVRQQQSSGSAAASSASAPREGSTSSSSSSGVSVFNPSPWELMGRVVNEQRIAIKFDLQLNQGLVRSAAARESGLEFDAFEARLQRLLTVMPFLQGRLLRIQPKLLAALAADPELMATRLIQLKSLLPAANLAAVVGQRPSLLLTDEWERVPEAVAQLLRHYSEQEVAMLVEKEPLLLAEDVDAVLAELARLAPSNADVKAMLLNNPQVIYSVQSGSRSLGPGAEFV